MTETIALADYLLTRLRQLGIEAIHGVPGDYNLELLDHVEDQGFNWVGNCNELNAGYAADGYARIKGAGALITTFGVGELSAINAVAGAFAESAPVVHIVGTPKRHQRATRALIHHSLNDGEYTYFSRMYESITVAQAILEDPRTCPLQIDTALQQCLIHSRPVYITVPADMVKTPVSSARLTTKIQVPLAISSSEETRALNAILERIYKSQRPLLFVDGESRAFGILGQLDELMKLTTWPTWTSVFGKSCVDETLPNYCNIWRGPFATQEERDAFEAADLILCFGPHFSGTNTYLHVTIPPPEKTVLFKTNSIQSGDEVFRDLPAKHFLNKLISKLDNTKISKSNNIVVRPDVSSKIASLPADGTFTQDMFYHVVGQYLRGGDILLGETGTAGYGCRDFRLPPKCHLFKPVTWLSIGYMLPAAQGAALAQQELHKNGVWPPVKSDESTRTILLIGDGSVQMTVQEISTMIRAKLNITIIVINNNGYTIERCIHGKHRAYNDIAPWRFLDAPGFFGASSDPSDGYHAETAQARTWSELHKFMQVDKPSNGPRLRMIEAFLPEQDAPVPLNYMLESQK
ncbi:hypothetical protein AMS68_000704 [Peltaster fructicola]|uniref:Pyruvate decarboxylase n=1 Tax=Peltaster fructicola TaxID=286661 RepID=A0A6H0XKC0_9PEZI|nr:hypothetical protein AMS68_000704 [Peltaster fructicola]